MVILEFIYTYFMMFIILSRRCFLGIEDKLFFYLRSWKNFRQKLMDKSLNKIHKTTNVKSDYINYN